jgi:hypothetical protein
VGVDDGIGSTSSAAAVAPTARTRYAFTVNDLSEAKKLMT